MMLWKEHSTSIRRASMSSYLFWTKSGEDCFLVDSNFFQQEHWRQSKNRQLSHKKNTLPKMSLKGVTNKRRRSGLNSDKGSLLHEILRPSQNFKVGLRFRFAFIGHWLRQGWMCKHYDLSSCFIYGNSHIPVCQKSHQLHLSAAHSIRVKQGKATLQSHDSKTWISTNGF